MLLNIYPFTLSEISESSWVTKTIYSSAIEVIRSADASSFQVAELSEDHLIVSALIHRKVHSNTWMLCRARLSKHGGFWKEAEYSCPCNARKELLCSHLIALLMMIFLIKQLYTNQPIPIVFKFQLNPNHPLFLFQSIATAAMDVPSKIRIMCSLEPEHAPSIRRCNSKKQPVPQTFVYAREPQKKRGRKSSKTSQPAHKPSVQTTSWEQICLNRRFVCRLGCFRAF